MSALTSGDLRRLLDFIERAALVGTRADPLPRGTLCALRELVPADTIAYFELRRSDRALLAYSDDRDVVSAPGSDAALAAYSAQNPLGWRRWGPADGALRLSQVVAHRALRRLDFYHAYMVPNRIRDSLKVWLASGPYSVACISLDRSAADFSARDAAILGVLHGHLVAIRERALAGGADPLSVALTPREAEVLSWAILGYRDAEIADRLSLAPATVSKHLERCYGKLGARSRSEASAAILRPRYVARQQHPTASSAWIDRPMNTPPRRIAAADAGRGQDQDLEDAHPPPLRRRAADDPRARSRGAPRAPR